MSAEEVVAFIEDSFGAFQQQQAAPSWEWGRQKLEAAVADLARHELIADDGAGRYSLAPLGRLAGESGTDVASIIRLVDALRLPFVAMNDATLIALTQITTELDDIYLLLNKRSKNKEPQRWVGGLQQEGVATRLLQIGAREVPTVTLRAKKAAACLLWMSGRSRQEIHAGSAAASTKFFGTYPGMYIPQPLGLRCDRTESAPKALAEEVLALTKMNWNNTQFDGHDPITVRAARQVGKILKYVGPDEPVEPRYAHYM